MIRKDGVTIVDRREMLKVKIKSLAEEARIIRREEHRTCGALRAELHWHRVLAVRHEARATHLAYGLIKGRKLEQIEKPLDPRTETLWVKVRKMIERYGPCAADAKQQLLEQCRS